MLRIKNPSHEGLLVGDSRVQGLDRVAGPLHQGWKNVVNGGLGRRDAHSGKRSNHVLPGEVRQALDSCLIQWSEINKNLN